MKTFIIPVVLAVIAFAASAFTAQKKTADHTTVKANTVWYFTGDNINEADQATHWSQTDPQLGCGSGVDLPCQMTVADAPDQTSLQNFLIGKSDVAIREIYADSKRAE